MASQPKDSPHERAGVLAASCPLPLSHHSEITLGHGSGGKLSHDLIEGLIAPTLGNAYLNLLHDGAVVPIHGGKVAFSTDSFVVNPVFFPGGDIGRLAVNGTVNDIAMCGAKPLFLSVGLILEEGFPLKDLQRILRSMKDAADQAGVSLVTGDTKVVDRGKGDRIFINTSGIGLVREGLDIQPKRARPGDRLIISGGIAEHGIAIMSVRDGLEFETEIRSDTAPLNGLVDAIVAACPEVHVLRDLTRGGLASALNEIAAQAEVGIRLEENDIPIGEAVRGACEILGLDPLYVANEGKLVAIVPAGHAEAVTAAMRAHPLGLDAAVAGEVVSERPGRVTMRTPIGGERIVDMLPGDQLPRIC